MRIVEPHTHMSTRVTDDYEKMAICGIESVIEPAFWSGLDRRYPETFFDYFAHLLEFESNRAAQYGIKYFCCIGMNPKEATLGNVPRYGGGPDELYRDKADADSARRVHDGHH